MERDREAYANPLRNYSRPPPPLFVPASLIASLLPRTVPERVRWLQVFRLYRHRCRGTDGPRLAPFEEMILLMKDSWSESVGSGSTGGRSAGAELVELIRLN